MNKVLLAGRLTRDPELRSLASGKAVTQFSVSDYTNENRPPSASHGLAGRSRDRASKDRSGGP